MPDEFEGLDPQQQTEVESEPFHDPEAEAPGVQVETGSTTPKYVRYQQFREANEEKNQTKRENEYLRQQLLHATGVMMQAAQANRPPVPPPPTPVPPGVDPELAKIMDPLLSPLRAQNEYLARENAEIKADLMSQREWDRLVTAVPDIEDLKDGIVDYLNSRPEHERRILASSSATILPIAQFVRAMRTADGRTAAQNLQSDVRSRARSAKGAPATQPTNPTNVDWSALSGESFFARARELGIDI